jgi:hypothetical protein
MNPMRPVVTALAVATALFSQTVYANTASTTLADDWRPTALHPTVTGYLFDKQETTGWAGLDVTSPDFVGSIGYTFSYANSWNVSGAPNWRNIYHLIVRDGYSVDWDNSWLKFEGADNWVSFSAFRADLNTPPDEEWSWKNINYDPAGPEVYDIGGVTNYQIITKTLEREPIEAFRLAYTNTNVSAAAVPEPDVYIMLLTGLGLVGAAARRKQAVKK